MEFGRQDEEKRYNPPPLQQPTFTMPLPSSTSLHYVTEAKEVAGEARRNEMESLIQEPTPTSAPALESASCGVDGERRTNSTTTITSTRAATAPRYRECLRNHAASLGGHILDGCCEFMPCSDNAPKCAACGCHRSFHRKDIGMNSQLMLPQPHHLAPSPPAPHHHNLNLKPFDSAGVLLHTGASVLGTATESSSEELMALQQQFIVSKKRIRTKFTAEQKERMMAFAEKVGWRMPKQDEAAVEQFCGEVGVSRQVLKVWMHNNKNSSRKQQQQEEEQQQQHQDMPQV